MSNLHTGAGLVSKNSTGSSSRYRFLEQSECSRLLHTGTVEDADATDKTKDTHMDKKSRQQRFGRTSSHTRSATSHTSSQIETAAESN